MLTLIGVGTCEHPNWHHALARPTGSISVDPAIEGFTLVVTAPGAEEEPTGTHRAVVEWTGVVSSQAAVAEIRNARADGSDLLVEIQVR